MSWLYNIIVEMMIMIITIIKKIKVIKMIITILKKIKVIKMVKTILMILTAMM